MLHILTEENTFLSHSSFLIVCHFVVLSLSNPDFTVCITDAGVGSFAHWQMGLM